MQAGKEHAQNVLAELKKHQEAVAMQVGRPQQSRQFKVSTVIPRPGSRAFKCHVDPSLQLRLLVCQTISPVNVHRSLMRHTSGTRFKSAQFALFRSCMVRHRDIALITSRASLRLHNLCTIRPYARQANCCRSTRSLSSLSCRAPLADECGSGSTQGINTLLPYLT